MEIDEKKAKTISLRLYEGVHDDILEYLSGYLKSEERGVITQLIRSGIQVEKAKSRMLQPGAVVHDPSWGYYGSPPPMPHSQHPAVQQGVSSSFNGEQGHSHSEGSGAEGDAPAQAPKKGKKKGGGKAEEKPPADTLAIQMSDEDIDLFAGEIGEFQ